MIKPEFWRPADELILEPNAFLAAREPTMSLTLTAGPGAGKTEMLAQRADFLLRTGTCRFPQRILAISFKVDAARNLKERVRRRCGADLSARLDSHTFHAFSKRLIDRFRPVLVGMDTLDPDYTIGPKRIQGRQIEFADLTPLAVQILQTCQVARNAVRQTYSHVFLDEFQDCTNLQYQLIREAFLNTGIPLTAVGDTKQRIMGWAGALEGVFQQFAKDFGAKPLNLYQNFRAQPLLRRMQNAMVRVMDPAAAVPDDELKGAGGSIEIVPSANDREEAEVVVDRIEHWIGAGTPLSEIAVLVPRQPELYTQQLALELSRRGVPFRNEQALQDLATEPVALLIVDFLRVVMGEREFDAYGRLMDVLLSTGIDEDQAYSLRSGWHRFLESSRNQMASQEAEATRSAQALIELSNQFLSMVGKGLLSGLSADYEQGSRLLDVISQTYERISELLLQNPEPINALSRFSAENTVRIMTIHKSKGLEFDSVVMMGVERTTYWGKIEDERSVFFVGISRAKKRLVLTVVGQRGRPENFSGRWDVQRLPHEEFLGYAHNLKR